MIELKIDWTKENTWDFVKYTALYKSTAQKAIIISYLVCLAFIIAAGIITLCTIGSTMMLWLCAAAIIILVGYAVCYYFMMKGVAKKVLNQNASDDKISVELTDDSILVLKDNIPGGLIGWDKINEISFGKKAIYVMTEDNALLILEYSELTSGTADELKALLEKKKSEIKLSKKA